ncbi:FAD-binding oxidoreductase [Flavimaricola marinus]|uniref:Putative FAD-linked oxidoreductase n=1 Tax=Flavimaricola marinus TaxID=1819565 RepID=A0A238LCS5_9RHOB|nr:FAD-binding oxidoreductase [Flavimaricola marinus]SMY06720.1 putative FAD-linked oxidoreductase [Flavimaricola marinus]
MTNHLDALRDIVGAANIATGSDCDKWNHDWMGDYHFSPLAVVRPANTDEVSRVMQLAHEVGLPVVPVSGNTGLAGGTYADGAVMLSLDRMNTIREIRAESRIAIVEAGVILYALSTAAQDHGLLFPMTFGARGSAMIGGILSTNAGGSNVLRYGNTRDLCMGVEVVLADGRVMDLMSELHKDNSGLNLRNLVIGAEGTLGIITAAVMKLAPQPLAYATAMLAVPHLSDAVGLLNQLQKITGGAVSAFEYMPKSYISRYLATIAGAKPPFEGSHDVNILVEVGATAPRDATPQDDGSVPIVSLLETELARMLEIGTLRDAVIAQNDAQRAEMWARREAAAEVTSAQQPMINNDVCVGIDKVETFLTTAIARIQAIDPEATDTCVSHLGDGNVHYIIFPSSADPELRDKLVETVEDVVQSLGGSFSAEHGIGLSKLPSMRRRKDPVALDVMRAIKAALDPKGILNPGKVIPR